MLQHRLCHRELLRVQRRDVEHGVRQLVQGICRGFYTSRSIATRTGMMLYFLTQVLQLIKQRAGLGQQALDALLLGTLHGAVHHPHESLDLLQLHFTPLSSTHRSGLQLLLPERLEALPHIHRLWSGQFAEHGDHVAAVGVLPEEESARPRELVRAAVELTAVVLPHLLHRSQNRRDAVVAQRSYA